MNNDEFKGKLENAKGRVKEAAGALSGNKQTQAEGMIDRAKGAVREKVGEIKGDVKRDVNRDLDDSDDE